MNGEGFLDDRDFTGGNGLNVGVISCGGGSGTYRSRCNLLPVARFVDEEA